MNSTHETARTLAANELAPNGTASSRTLLIWGICILLLVTVGAIAGFLPRHHHREALRTSTHDLAVPTVTVVIPVTGKISVAPQLPAEIRAFTDSPIYARANGYLKKWYVDIGTEVKSGQLLAEIETPDLDQDLARSKAELKQSEAALELSRTTAKRWAELVKSASVGEQESAEKQADLALKTATGEASSAAVHRLEELKSFGRIIAPFDGTITARRTDIGDLVRADSGKELFHLAQTKTLRVFVRVPQMVARSVKAGHAAALT